jgi:hypothetical protein
MDQKYLKYKNKYLSLKNNLQFGGSSGGDPKPPSPVAGAGAGDSVAAGAGGGAGGVLLLLDLSYQKLLKL